MPVIAINVDSRQIIQPSALSRRFRGSCRGCLFTPDSFPNATSLRAPYRCLPASPQPTPALLRLPPQRDLMPRSPTSTSDPRPPHSRRVPPPSPPPGARRRPNLNLARVPTQHSLPLPHSSDQPQKSHSNYVLACLPALDASPFIPAPTRRPNPPTPLLSLQIAETKLKLTSSFSRTQIRFNVASAAHPHYEPTFTDASASEWPTNPRLHPPSHHNTSALHHPRRLLALPTASSTPPALTRASRPSSLLPRRANGISMFSNPSPPHLDPYPPPPLVLDCPTAASALTSSSRRIPPPPRPPDFLTPKPTPVNFSTAQHAAAAFLITHDAEIVTSALRAPTDSKML
ncbi:hypothetical protein R3P38DRAFT_3291954 [Favolaschia claudopus]|uniref:Uncharacterized protein n=1 Tax=Favolaschia claudopus TaxID=2862362 RepID=A0AAV9ZMJ8_9AGAR